MSRIDTMVDVHDDPGGDEWVSPEDRDERSGEEGFSLVFSALLLFVLLGMAAFGIDVARWWLMGQEMQKAADAAALGGVVHLPDNPTSANTTALQIAQRNGFTNGGNATVVPSQDTQPTKLRVSITHTFDNFFGGIFGRRTMTLTRSAVADFTSAVPMGSPANYLGQDPDLGNLQRLWLNIAGPNSTKVSGDRYQAKVCATSVFNCGTGNPNNNDYLFDGSGTTNGGYRFVTRVKTVTAGQPLVIQVYDPAFIYVGDSCTVNMPTQAQANALQATYGANPFFADAATRFAPGANDFCTGDQRINSLSNMNTSFTVRAPDATPWNDLDNPIVSGCSVNFPPVDAPLLQYLDPANANYTTPTGVYVRANFRRWVTVCTVPAGSVVTGDYVVQVRSNHQAAAPTAYDPLVATGGHNRLSLRAGFNPGTGIPNGANVSLYANGKLPIYVNAGNNATPTFYLARITPSAAGRTLHLEFFDIGDVSGGTTNMQVLPPSEYAATFAGCTYQRDNAAATAAPTCSQTGMASGQYNGRLVTVTVPIPSDYTCNVADPAGCWVRVQLSFSAGAQPQDTTTWSANVDGDPVRLVQ